MFNDHDQVARIKLDIVMMKLHEKGILQDDDFLIFYMSPKTCNETLFNFYYQLAIRLKDKYPDLEGKSDI